MIAPWKSLCLFCTVVVLLIVSFAAQSADAATSWEAVGRAWQQYLTNPSAEAAESLYTLLPRTSDELSIDSDTGFIADSIYENLDALRNPLEASERNAVRVAFRLYTIANEDFVIWLDELLGGFIRIDPQMFLEELKNHREVVPDLVALTNSFGPEVTESGQSFGDEAELRVEALESVMVDSLSGVREECIKSLREDE